MEKSDKLYYRGTIFDVSYEWDGRQESHRAILAELPEEDFVFQVIQINEHHAGCVDGWIHLQFEHVNYERAMKRKDLRLRIENMDEPARNRWIFRNIHLR